MRDPDIHLSYCFLTPTKIQMGSFYGELVPRVETHNHIPWLSPERKVARNRYVSFHGEIIIAYYYLFGAWPSDHRPTS